MNCGQSKIETRFAVSINLLQQYIVLSSSLNQPFELWSSTIRIMNLNLKSVDECLSKGPNQHWTSCLLNCLVHNDRTNIDRFLKNTLKFLNFQILITFLLFHSQTKELAIFMCVFYLNILVDMEKGCRYSHCHRFEDILGILLCNVVYHINRNILKTRNIYLQVSYKQDFIYLLAT